MNSSGRCTACGAESRADQSFCGRCGAPLVTADAGAATASTATGWDLAAAGMSVPAPAGAGGPGSPLDREETASWGARLGGWLLDGVFQVVIIALLWVLAWFLAGETLRAEIEQGFEDMEYERDTAAVMTTWIVLAVMFLASWLFTLAWEIGWVRGRAMAKPGQRIAGFRVVTADDLERVSFWRALGRTAAKQLYSFWYLGTLFTIAAAFTIGLTRRRQGLHDLMAGTACVRTDALRARGIGPDAAGMYDATRTDAAAASAADARPAATNDEPSGHTGPFVP